MPFALPRMLAVVEVVVAIVALRPIGQPNAVLTFGGRVRGRVDRQTRDHRGDRRRREARRVVAQTDLDVEVGDVTADASDAVGRRAAVGSAAGST